MNYRKNLDKNDYKEIADFFIDRECNTNGITETIDLLLSAGFEKDVLLALHFSEIDIDKMLEK